MSNIRHVSKKERDVEAQPLVAATTSATASASNSFNVSPASSHNPVFLAKSIFRKVADIISRGDDDIDLCTLPGMVSLLSDIIIGVSLGLLVISFLIFLDHRNVIHLESAHNFRNAAFELINDPETLATIEESSDLKFITVENYEDAREEIDSVVVKIARGNEKLAEHSAEKLKNEKEINEIKPEYDKLAANPILELDKFCASCPWEGTTCQGRVDYLMNTYNIRVLQAQLGAMNNPSCKGS